MRTGGDRLPRFTRLVQRTKNINGFFSAPFVWKGKQKASSLSFSLSLSRAIRADLKLTFANKHARDLSVSLRGPF